MNVIMLIAECLTSGKKQNQIVYQIVNCIQKDALEIL